MCYTSKIVLQNGCTKQNLRNVVHYYHSGGLIIGIVPNPKTWCKQRLTNMIKLVAPQTMADYSLTTPSRTPIAPNE